MDSYSLREVADLLGVEFSTLQRRVREGAFPGRFMVNGPAGPEMRVPAADVDRLGGVGRAGGWGHRRAESLVPIAASEIDAISSIPAQRVSSHLSHADVSTIRDAFMDAIRAEREWMVESVQDALAVRDRTISDLRQEVGSMRRAVEAATSLLERVDDRLRAAWRTSDDPAWADVIGGDSERVDVDRLLREIGELESLLDDGR